MAETSSNGTQPAETAEGITKITVGGFKSISHEQSIEVRPLTLLAGANSSGKSSIMQPLLLMKQTLEVPYDPGALRINGPNVNFTAANQMLSHGISSFQISVLGENLTPLEIVFSNKDRNGFDVEAMNIGLNPKWTFNTGMSHDNVISYLDSNDPTTTYRIISDIQQDLSKELNFNFGKVDLEYSIVHNRCFLDLKTTFRLSPKIEIPVISPLRTELLRKWVLELVHVPGLRGLPARNYPVTAVSSTFPGTFENYTASVVLQWQKDGDSRLNDLRIALKSLGLTSHVSAEPMNDTEVELRVGRLPSGNSNEQDMVSIADVGLGVSQTLPVLVALFAAKAGQLVYLEQPEIHLHPRAQVALAHVLADAAKRGVRVVAETHSSLLLLGVQTLVAEGKLSPELVKLHWFTRGEDGATTIQSADLDEGGAFGDWPDDFDDVTLDAQSRFLDAAERHLIGK